MLDPLKGSVGFHQQHEQFAHVVPFQLRLLRRHTAIVASMRAVGKMAKPATP
jgi:hypothetical protein